MVVRLVALLPRCPAAFALAGFALAVSLGDPAPAAVPYGLSCNASDLCQIDTGTGSANPVGVVLDEFGAGIDGSARAFDGAGTLYVLKAQTVPEVGRVNPTGASAFDRVPIPGFPTGIGNVGMEFDDATGTPLRGHGLPARHTEPDCRHHDAARFHARHVGARGRRSLPDPLAAHHPRHGPVRATRPGVGALLQWRAARATPRLSANRLLAWAAPGEPRRARPHLHER